MFNFYFNFKNKFNFIKNKEKFKNVKILDAIYNNNSCSLTIAECKLYNTNVIVFFNMMTNLKCEFLIKEFLTKLRLIKIIIKLQLNHVFY